MKTGLVVKKKRKEAKTYTHNTYILQLKYYHEKSKTKQEESTKKANHQFILILRVNYISSKVLNNTA